MFKPHVTLFLFVWETFDRRWDKPLIDLWYERVACGSPCAQDQKNWSAPSNGLYLGKGPHTPSASSQLVLNLWTGHIPFSGFRVLICKMKALGSLKSNAL